LSVLLPNTTQPVTLATHSSANSVQDLHYRLQVCTWNCAIWFGTNVQSGCCQHRSL